MTAEPIPLFGRPLVRVAEVGSTSDLARLLAAAGLPEGTVVVAARQTRGRGRFGRTWISPLGGLWCSLLLRPDGDAEWGLLSLAVAVAVAETVDRIAGVRSMIRWPNDVLIDGGKVAGILAEAVSGAAIVGVGINADIDLHGLPDDLRTPAASLAAAAGGPVVLSTLLDILLERCAWWYAAWTRRDPAVAAAWSARDAIRGTRVNVHGADGMVEGVALGIDTDGALLLRMPGGQTRRIVAGDLDVPSSTRLSTAQQEPI